MGIHLETSGDVLNWYERQPQTLTKDFISSIPWSEVRDHPLDPKFVPVLQYMRDIEVLTEMYHDELRSTPTGRDRNISKFMDRWGQEELVHGEVLDRFLNEAGFETPGDWRDRLRSSISHRYKIYTSLTGILTNLIGKSFTAAHMTFGAIHEMETAQGYRRLATLAKHPVLELIITGILREESAHTNFYWNMARLELRKSPAARRVARYVVEKFWTPVGQGSVPRARTEVVVKTLFGDEESMSFIDTKVTDRIGLLPGFDGLNTVSDKMRRIAGLPQVNRAF